MRSFVGLVLSVGRSTRRRRREGVAETKSLARKRFVGRIQVQTVCGQPIEMCVAVGGSPQKTPDCAKDREGFNERRQRHTLLAA